MTIIVNIIISVISYSAGQTTLASGVVQTETVRNDAMFANEVPHHIYKD